ncbi:collagen-like protein [Dactylosporangium aurantiacum]|uniref:Collagen-like protein n=1 Tax=Dactylosporangium aurantiacum TaxID=35754 RepID=A0A9Q9MIV7_9ACTN|nr:collagen-like protein [Dactylosporangium aurantiacum]MDG6109531.1 collagen-like protein [Dactylosporangium aurantiacum]UWZ51312.1 collagen-like protein [Dactylosporangium aurantiacum]
MRFDEFRNASDLHAAQTERIRQALEGSDLGVVAVSEATRPAEPQFGGLHRGNGAVLGVEIVHDADNVRVVVDTARQFGNRPLRWMVEHQLRRAGERFSTQDWSEGDATVIVDGAPVAGRIVRAGQRWWAARCRLGDLEISVGAQDWHPDVIAVETVADVVAMLARLQPPAPRGSAGAPRPAGEPGTAGEPVPDQLRREPHRALVDMVLAATAEHAAWLADGGVLPDLPRHWGTLWHAAVRRHIELTDEPEPAAEESVRRIVDELANLHRNAVWFRESPALRERAIDETLLHGTGLSHAVPSRPAHLAWRQLRNSAEQDPQAYHTVHEGWLAAWADWAGGQEARPHTGH